MKTQAVHKNHVITKSFVDHFLRENEQFRRELGMDFLNKSKDSIRNNQDIIFNNYKLSNLDSNTVNRNTGSDNEITIKRYVDDYIGAGTVFRINQLLQNYLKVIVGKDIYNLTKYRKKTKIDKTINNYPNTGGYLLQQWI